jgi:hypothetical protein
MKGWAMTHNAFTPRLQYWRWYDDDGTELTSTALTGSENTTYDADVSAGFTTLHLRIMIEETGTDTDDGNNTVVQLRYNDGTDTNVTAASSKILAAGAVSGLTDNADTTDRATNGLTNGSGTFVAGEQEEGDGQVTVTNALTASNYTEHVFAITVVAADVANGDSFTFDVTYDGSAVTNNSTPTLTIKKDALGEGDPTASDDDDVVGEGVSKSLGDGSPTATADAAVVGEGAIAADNAGNGDLTATSDSAVVGEGLSKSNGEGALQAQAAAAVGEGASSSSGNGALQSGAATIDSSGARGAFPHPVSNLTSFGVAGFRRPYGTFGTAQADHQGNGDLVATDDDAVVGEGTSSSSGNGALSVGTATVAGSGTSSSAGNGALTANDNDAIVGEGTTSSAGNGVLAANDDDAIVGEGTTQSLGSGALAANDDDAVVGEGTSSSAGNGALAAEAATVVGEGTSQGAGSGSLVATDDDAVVGEGTSSSAGNGALTVGTATVAGSGTSQAAGNGALTSTDDDAVVGEGVTQSVGNGALQAGDATVAGTGYWLNVEAALKAGDATVAGSGSAELLADYGGQGNLKATDDDAVVGEGISSSAGNGALAADGATVAGSGVTVAYGEGALSVGTATVAGEGISLSVGDGVLVANDDDAVVGEGFYNAGNGALTVGLATVVGEGVRSGGDVGGEQVKFVYRRRRRLKASKRAA